MLPRPSVHNRTHVTVGDCELASEFCFANSSFSKSDSDGSHILLRQFRTPAHFASCNRPWFRATHVTSASRYAIRLSARTMASAASNSSLRVPVTIIVLASADPEVVRVDAEGRIARVKQTLCPDQWAAQQFPDNAVSQCCSPRVPDATIALAINSASPHPALCLDIADDKRPDTDIGAGHLGDGLTCARTEATTAAPPLRRRTMKRRPTQSARAFRTFPEAQPHATLRTEPRDRAMVTGAKLHGERRLTGLTDERAHAILKTHRSFNSFGVGPRQLALCGGTCTEIIPVARAFGRTG
jgi:hypothetical protein